MMKVKSIIDFLNDQVKLKDQETWDNSGLQIGSENCDINKIMLTLDLDMEVAEYAVREKVDLIISHHPFFFSSIKRIDIDSYDGKIIELLIKNHTNLYSLHTTYDMAEKGVNYDLARKLNISNFQVLHPINIDKSGYGGIGDINPVNIIDYAQYVKGALDAEYVKLYYGDEGKIIRRVAFCGGSGSEFIEDAIKLKADLYITGDIKYHQAQTALKNNLSIIDAGHYNTEVGSMEILGHALKKTGIEIINYKKNTVAEKII